MVNAFVMRHYLTTAESRVTLMHLAPLSWWLRRWFCCCWFIVLCTSHCLWGFCVGLCFGMHYVMPFLVLQSSLRGREGWLLTLIVFWMSCFCKCPVALPQGAVGWSAFCDCGISWSYSLNFRCKIDASHVATIESTLYRRLFGLGCVFGFSLATCWY